eukprot:4061864-Amphidinium_carterae.2
MSKGSAPEPELKPDVRFQGEWDLPIPYQQAVDDFTKSVRLTDVGLQSAEASFGLPYSTASCC